MMNQVWKFHLFVHMLEKILRPSAVEEHFMLPVKLHFSWLYLTDSLAACFFSWVEACKLSVMREYEIDFG